MTTFEMFDVLFTQLLPCDRLTRSQSIGGSIVVDLFISLGLMSQNYEIFCLRKADKIAKKLMKLLN